MQESDNAVFNRSLPERNKSLTYTSAPLSELKKWVNDLVDLFNGFLEDAGYPDFELYVGYHLLYEALDRVDKRIAYYWCYHGIEASERKVAALIAYWIVRFKPFVCTDESRVDQKEYVCINERFALYIILSVVAADAGIQNIDQGMLNSDYAKKLFYTFRYRNVSIDTIVTLCEGLTPQSFELEYPDEEE